MTLQTDPGWLPERQGCLSASRFKDATDYLKQTKKEIEAGDPPRESEKRRKYKMELVAERIAGHAVDKYVTPAMQRGLDLEPAARELFEETTGLLVGPARLFHHVAIPYLCATPDGTIGVDTLVEFKCPLVSTYVEWVDAGVIPEDHIPQMTLQCLVTGRRKVFFCGFCPEMRGERRLFIREFVPSLEALLKAEDEAVKFLNEVEALFERVTATEAPKEEA